MTELNDLTSYFDEQSLPNPRYAGQLTPAFQTALGARYETSDPATCLFAETVELLDGTVLDGSGDYRGGEADHLGGYQVGGKRVLEFGAGSGWLTAYLARQGAEVVSLDLPVGSERLTSPSASVAPVISLAAIREVNERLRRGWWHVKQRDGFAAKMVYCDLEYPPNDLGRFDVSVFSNTLLRLPNPYMALGAAAARTAEAIVITEPVTAVMLNADPDMPLATFAPDLGADGGNHWWHHSPAELARMLLTLGFGAFESEVHTAHRANISFFTIVAKRLAT